MRHADRACICTNPYFSLKVYIPTYINTDLKKCFSDVRHLCTLPTYIGFARKYIRIHKTTIWEALRMLEWKMLVYFIAIWYFYGYLLYTMANRYILWYLVYFSSFLVCFTKEHLAHGCLTSVSKRKPMSKVTLKLNWQPKNLAA
jgi:hypothetical protein